MLVLNHNVHTSFWQLSMNDKSTLPFSVDITLSTGKESENNGSGTIPMSTLSSESVLSVSPASARLSIPSSDTSDEQNELTDTQQNRSHDCETPDLDVLEIDPGSKSLVEQHVKYKPSRKLEHVIHLSGIEHCMPRSYIRICLAYALPDPSLLSEVVKRLNSFVRKTVDAKPYLAGYVAAVKAPGKPVGAVEIRFSDHDFINYPGVSVRELGYDEIPFTYSQLDKAGLPPSAIRPELVSALSESADEERAPVFRVQANVIDGGIIVSVYLHHCISDGTGAGLLISGSVLKDQTTFDKCQVPGAADTSSLTTRLSTFANLKSEARKELSWAFSQPLCGRSLRCKKAKPEAKKDNPARVQGRGCVIAFSRERFAVLKSLLQTQAHSSFITSNDTLQALLWHGMVKARISSLKESSVTVSKLLIPINIRGKLETPLPESYFGAAIDFASAELPLKHLEDTSPTSMVQTAMEIRQAINSVDEPYIRQAIALGMSSDPTIDVRDLQASNMDRTTGADMYVTSWEKLDCYKATFDLGLGQPDWVRKPWSRDPGSCIVLPFDDRKDFLEVVIQMTEADMGRLLQDQDFMRYVVRVIE